MKLLIFIFLVIGITSCTQVDPMKLDYLASEEEVTRLINGTGNSKVIGNVSLHNASVTFDDKTLSNLKKVIKFDPKASIIVDSITENYYRVCVCYPNGAINYILALTESDFSIIKSQEVVY